MLLSGESVGREGVSVVMLCKWRAINQLSDAIDDSKDDMIN